VEIQSSKCIVRLECYGVHIIATVRLAKFQLLKRECLSLIHAIRTFPIKHPASPFTSYYAA
jgi:hypothetical protein